jgi:hypothetical protein
MFLLLIDDFSRYMWIVLLPSMDGVLEAIKQVRAEAEATSGKKLRCLRTDRGGEFLSNDFIEYCSETGVRCQLTTMYSPQQNGMVE